jgi:hypothetical protein
MKKATISICYDDEKLSAIRMFLSQKGLDFEAELLSTADTLYKKHVPLGVREFIDMKDSAVTKKAEPKHSARQDSAHGGTL